MSTETTISMFCNSPTSLNRRDPCLEEPATSSPSSLIPLFHNISIDDQRNTITEWRILNQQYDVSYKGLKVPTPIKTFSECNLNPHLLTALANTTPSPIDMATVPLALHQRDVLCSGVTDVAPKARVFILPLLMRILTLPRMSPMMSRSRRPRNTKGGGGGPYAVILVPDRDLGEALHSLIIWFYPILRISVFELYAAAVDMIEGAPVVIATPFRLYDSFVRRLVTLDQCSFVALYQVDQILDSASGSYYLDHIIKKAMPTHYLKPETLGEEFVDGEVYQTTYMICSTITPLVQRLADEFLRSPVLMNLGQPLCPKTDY
ncbi:DEAD-box ATP-dependent RNA helicase 21-like [Silene latifolia]|uniref:DEAD-box ATP-dependent RNA helicase 21-like n=1 Tax=Silene latifolia TaxID=37657 RepID=UPI003D7786E7